MHKNQLKWIQGLMLLCLGLLGLRAPAFAIDQVLLNNGRLVEGTVLNDVPNRHVDIRLSNGRTERFPQSDVARVERDVPSSNDRSMLGTESKGWLSLLVGGHVDPSQNAVGGTRLDFLFGAKVGIHAANLEVGRISFALSYNYVSSATGSGFVTFNQDFHDLNVQALLTKVGGSGFYFGPNLGLALFTGNAGFVGAGGGTLSSYFEYGLGAGYEIFVSKNFAIGPDLRYEEIMTIQRSSLNFALQGSFQF